jgi:NADP-dependent 3-hydroxy acid dehydrogenase YdfG
MELNLKDKVAFITGAGMGIAKAIASALAKEGTNISFMDINKEALEESRKEIQTIGVKVQTSLGSVTEVEDVKRAVDSTI